MEYTPKEKAFEKFLSIISYLFLAGSLLTIYFFLIQSNTSNLFLIFLPVILFLQFLFAKIGSEGIRKNYIFTDLLSFSFLALSIFALIHIIVALIKYGTIGNIYGITFVINLALFITAVILWRKAVISRFSLKNISPTEALSYRALTEIIIADYKAEGYSFDTTVKDFDAYLGHIRSKETSQVRLVYFAMQYVPLLFLHLPLTWMGAQKRINFIKKRFYKAQGTMLTLLRSAKQLVYFIYYGSKPSFKSTGYVMFEERERYKEMKKMPEPPPLDVKHIKESKNVETDICVIGSGAAGAVAAYELAKNTGKRVTIVERGDYLIPQKDFTNLEPEMIGKLYKDGGLELTQDFDLAILQGICLGGSTTMNNGICFRTPRPVFEKWESLGAKLDFDKIENCFTRVEEIIKAKSINLNKTNEGANKFYSGAEKISMNPEWFVTNFEECGGAGYCNIGCKYNRKLSMLLNYLPLAQKEGAEIIVDAEAIKIKTEGKSATKLMCKNKSGTEFTISAKHFVIASGAIGSSGLLLRSGIKHNVGTRLSFNITTPMMAEFPSTINSFDGVQMCCYIKGNGFLVETTFNPPGASALIMQGWFEQLNKRMLNYTNYATAAPVVGSEPNGKVKLSFFKKTEVDYSMTKNDFLKLKEGMKALCRIFIAGGAAAVMPSSYDDLIVRSDDDLHKIDNEIRKPEDISLSSAHPQGGNPISDNKNIGAVDTNFRVHGYNNLYVCDASVFPTGVDVNPQLSIMGISNYAADKIAENI